MLMIVFATVQAQDTMPLQFDHLTIEDGLSQSTVNCIYQDRRGFMWFGTQDGLNRYDGYNFKVYRHLPSDSTTLSDNYVWCIYEDSSGGFWVGTFGGGLNYLDRDSDRFTRYKPNPDDPEHSLSFTSARALLEFPRGNLWIGTDRGLCTMNLANREITNYRYQPSIHSSLQEENVLALEAEAPGTLWIGTSVGLNQWNTATGENRHYPGLTLIPAGPFSRHHWVETENGLAQITSAGEMIPIFSPGPQPATQILSLLEDRKGWLWVGTNNGLWRIPDRGHAPAQATLFRHQPDQPGSLGHNFIASLYENRGGTVWVGTREGLNQFNHYTRKFPHIAPLPEQTGGISQLHVLAFEASRRYPGSIWIGTTNGLSRFDPESGRFTVFRNDPADPHSLSSSYILDLYEDAQGYLWIGTRGGGLNRYNPETGHFTRYMPDPDKPGTISSPIVSYIYEDRRGELWIGTSRGGLNRFERESGIFHHIPYEQDSPYATRHSFIFSLLEDRQGNFWVGTAGGGLHLLDRRSGLFRYFSHDPEDPTSLSNSLILSIYEDRQGDIWIATAGRLNRLVALPAGSDSTGPEYQFVQYGKEDGLPNEVIYGILEDRRGYYWVSTNKGLARFRWIDDGMLRGRLEVRSYTVHDGLQSDEFNQNAYYRDSTGRLYFGGINGFNLFDPDSIRDNPHLPEVVITDFRIFNEKVPVGPNSPLREDISRAGEIFLTYRDQVISFEFAALNYARPEKNRYAYMMEGFDADWTESGHRRFATYTNLDPGEYTFRVKASNHDGVWNKRGTTLRITISPPPWKTWWAYSLYFLGIVGSIAGFIRYRLRAQTRRLQAEAEEKMRIEQARREERQRMRKKSAADFHDESGNVLTKISLFVELAKRLLSKRDDLADLQNYLHSIEENTKLLSGGMRDFIWSLDPEKDSLYHALVRLKDFGNGLFEHSEIRFHSENIDPALSRINLSMEQRRSLILIFKEAMNNCLKYSRADHVYFEVSLDDGELSVRLRDDGCGFDLEGAPAGYGLKNMAARAQKIGGLLAIDAAPGKGASVQLRKNLAWETDIPHMRD